MIILLIFQVLIPVSLKAKKVTLTGNLLLLRRDRESFSAVLQKRFAITFSATLRKRFAVTNPWGSHPCSPDAKKAV